MSRSKDRLYNLLPFVYRQRDAKQGYPLKALLQVIAEQVNIVEDDIAQLYENWFIETCQEWAVPYIGDLIGYRPVPEGGEAGGALAGGQRHNRILFPRREVANTIGYRRRKGTLALLEELAKSTAGWPARAVEFYRLLLVAQHLNFQHLDRGRTADMRLGDALERLDGPFDELAHAVDVRSINSHRTPGRYNIPSVGLFVWRLKSYSLSRAPACSRDGSPKYTFSVLGNNIPLFIKPVEEPEPTHIADETNVPAPIGLMAFHKRLEDFCGEGKSLCIWRDSLDVPVPIEKIIAADLSRPGYAPAEDYVAVDPNLGLISLSDSYLRKNVDAKLWVSYHYGFSSDIGGGEYPRELGQRPDQAFYRVGKGMDKKNIEKISDALDRWQQDKQMPDGKQDAIIEIQDSEDYAEPIIIELEPGDHLELRAANGCRPLIRILNINLNGPDYLKIESKGNGDKPRYLTLDGLLIDERGIQVTGQITEITIRHCTMVPGWSMLESNEIKEWAKPSLHLNSTTARLIIEKSILGYIQVDQDEVGTDPLSIRIEDSIIDAVSPESMALDASQCPVAHAMLTILRSTVLGEIQVHAIELAENCIFFGKVIACRRQKGCMRFCYVTPGPEDSPSRTPRRYRCQPDLVMMAAEEKARKAASDKNKTPSEEETKSAKLREVYRVRPQFNSIRFGTPDYCQLADACAEEIKRGADDQSEMGVFHDLFQPQKEANLRARVKEYTPAGTDVDIIFVN